MSCGAVTRTESTPRVCRVRGGFPRCVRYLFTPGGQVLHTNHPEPPRTLRHLCPYPRGADRWVPGARVRSTNQEVSVRPHSFTARHPRARALAVVFAAALIVAPTSTAAWAATEPAPSDQSTPPLPASVEIPDATLSEISANADAALAAAQQVRTDAETANAAVTASGLDVSGPAAVELGGLDAAVDRLNDHALTPVVVVPQMTADLLSTTTQVRAAVTDLTTRLAAAQEAAAAAQRAAEEAAAAQRAADEAAAAAAARKSAVSVAAASGDNSPGAAQAAAQQIAASEYGWGDDQFSCLVSLWNRESGWNFASYNSSSGATGIPQALPGNKMASAGADWQTNAVTQVRWGLSYINGSYGSPCAAWDHSEARGWY